MVFLFLVREINFLKPCPLTSRQTQLKIHPLYDLAVRMFVKEIYIKYIWNVIIHLLVPYKIEMQLTTT